MGKHSGEADYNRVCAAELMAKAQAAPSKAVRRAYLNMAMNWLHEAAFGQRSDDKSDDGEPKDRDHPPVDASGPKDLP
jgi:hypothetical protein